MFKKIKTIQSLFILFLLLGVVNFSYALEITYTSIGGKTITEDSTLVDFVAYFFNLAVVLATVVAVVVIVYAGFNLVMSRGEPGKVNDAKSKMTGAFFGLAILLGSFIIVNSINPNIFVVKNIETKCLSGIDIVSGEGKNKKENCLQGSQGNLDLGSISSTTWISDENAIPSIYVYTESGYKGTVSEVKHGGSIPSGTKSIYFMTNQEGIYLYDSTGYMPKDRSTPLILTGSVDDLNNSKDINGLTFSKIVKSIYIKQPSSGNYNAILFSSPAYTGTCSYVLNSITNLNNAGSTLYDNKPAIGQNNVSSIEVFKSYPSAATRGTVILYNGIGCPDTENDQVKKCSIDIPTGVAAMDNIKKHCPDFTGDVQSIRINGEGGIVLKTGNVDAFGYCQLWTLESIKTSQKDTCQNSIIGTNVYQGWFGLRPLSYIVFPIN